MPLHKIPSSRTKRLVWDMVVLGGIERMTEHLYSGAHIDDDCLADMRLLRQRLRAFDHALEQREIAANDRDPYLDGYDDERC